MSTLTFQIEEQKAGQLAEVARQRGLQIEELLQQITNEFLSRRTVSEGAFKEALTQSATENEELLRRLAK